MTTNNLTDAQLRGLKYYARLDDKSLAPVKGFSHDPRVIRALLDKGLINTHVDGFAGTTYRATVAGMILVRSVP